MTYYSNQAAGPPFTPPGLGGPNYSCDSNGAGWYGVASLPGNNVLCLFLACCHGTFTCSFCGGGQTSGYTGDQYFLQAYVYYLTPGTPGNNIINGVDGQLNFTDLKYSYTDTTLKPGPTPYGCVSGDDAYCQDGYYYMGVDEFETCTYGPGTDFCAGGAACNPPSYPPCPDGSANCAYVVSYELTA